MNVVIGGYLYKIIHIYPTFQYGLIMLLNQQNHSLVGSYSVHGTLSTYRTFTNTSLSSTNYRDLHNGYTGPGCVSVICGPMITALHTCYHPPPSR